MFVAADVREYNSWDERVRPRRNLPDPEQASQFISTALTGKPRYRVVLGVRVVLQPVLRIFGGTERWDRGGTIMIAFRAVSTPVPPVPRGGTTCSHQIFRSTSGTAGPTAETVEGLTKR